LPETCQLELALEGQAGATLCTPVAKYSTGEDKYMATIDLPRPLELVEKIILETRSGRAWIALSIGGCGILAHAGIGRHLREHQEERSIALKFTSRVLHALGDSPANERLSTPQILVDTAVAVIDDPQHVGLFCATWQCMPEGVEICSVGTSSVLVFEGDDAIQEAIDPHSVNTFLRNKGLSIDPVRGGRIPTHALGGPNSCTVDDVRVTHVPFLPTTTIAIIEDRRLADNIMQTAVPRNELPSFIEAWAPPGKRIRTSVLISW
jgi:hypothetical protein